MNEVSVSVVEEIKTLQAEIDNAGTKIRDIGLNAIKCANRIGELLTGIQEDCKTALKCRFADWVEQNCSFSERTAYKYMDLYKYRTKIADKETLQDCYNQISEIKQIEQKSEKMKAEMRVAECIKTGKKPEGWRRGTDDQLLADTIAYNERVKEAEKKRDEHIAQAKKDWEEQIEMRKKSQTIFGNVFEQTIGILNGVVDREEKMAEWKQKLRLSGDTISHGFSEALLDYLDSLGSDNERLSACHDIVKVVKQVANDLQEKINKSA